ncbi:MAG: toll/interleukin-1 receptor domain-containing protein [Tannerella sp.]|jgi:tetratricopeptide (TPR) repeat protein|nr:toll/interleukin-1 receptor domain-containing protein [Tannerella sp.]
MDTQKKNFFISCTDKDFDSVKWMIETLESAGHRITLLVGSHRVWWNFISPDKALEEDEWVICVCSKTYFEREHCRTELMAAGDKAAGKLIPVRVEEVDMEGVCSALIPIDLFPYENDERQKAAALLNGLSAQEHVLKKEQAGFPEKRFFNLPPRNLHFSGRKEILEKIHHLFKKNKRIAVLPSVPGATGIGKTQVALEYAHCHAGEYDFVWWVNAEKEATIMQACAEFAKTNELTGKNIDRLDLIIDDVKEWIAQKKKWLIVFDNAEDENLLASYMPRQYFNRQHILITSGKSHWEGTEEVDTDVFRPNEAAEFLTKRTRLPQDEFQLPLAEALGRLPLALELAAAYIKANKISYREYLNLLDTCPPERLKEYPDNASLQTVYKTWRISIDRITDHDSAKRRFHPFILFTFGKGKRESVVGQLLNLCAFLMPERIDYHWFNSMKFYLPVPLRLEARARAKSTFCKTLAELTRYSLAGIENNRIYFHRAIQQVTRDSLPPNEQQAWIRYCALLLIEQTHKDLTALIQRDMFLDFVPHFLSVAEWCTTEIKHLEGVYYFIGRGFDEQSIYGLALEWYRKSLSLSEKLLGEKHPATIATGQNIAKLYYKQEEYDQALEWYQKTLAIREKTLGKNHRDIAASCNHIASVYHDQEKYDQAMEWYLKAMSVRAKVRDRDIAIIYNNIATICDHMGEYGEAMEWNRKSLAIRERMYKNSHPDMSISYNNIATVHHNQGEYELALEWYRKAIAVGEDTLGEYSLGMANTFSNVADTYFSMKQYDQALEWNLKSLTIREKILEKDRPETATVHYRLGEIYQQLGKYEKAIASFRQSAAIREKLFGQEHIRTVSAYTGIATSYRQMGKPDRALEWFLKILAFAEKKLGPEHIDIAVIQNTIASIYRNQNKRTQALNWFLKVQEIYEKDPQDYLFLVTLYNSIAEIYHHQRDVNRATEYYCKAIDIFKNGLCDNQEVAFMTYSNLATVYLNQALFDKALKEYLVVYKLFFAKFDANHAGIVHVKKNMEIAYNKSPHTKPFGFEKWLADAIKDATCSAVNKQ